jgi:hypothetical protein
MRQQQRQPSMPALSACWLALCTPAAPWPSSCKAAITRANR